MTILFWVAAVVLSMYDVWNHLSDPDVTRFLTISGIYITAAFLFVLAVYMLILVVTTKARLVDKMFTWFVWSELIIVLLTVLRVNTGIYYTLWNSLAWINMAASILGITLAVIARRHGNNDDE